MLHLIEFNESFNVEYNETSPALMTLKEYMNILNSRNIHHSSNSYKLDLIKKSKDELKESNFKLIKTEFIGKLKIEYYDNNKSESYYEYKIIAYHPDEDFIVGSIQDEWGCTLVRVNSNYKGLGIGKILTRLYDEVIPNKESGGFTKAGYNLYSDLHSYYVSKYLEYGIYSKLVKNGKITISKVKEIIKSTKPKNKLYNQKNNILDIYNNIGEDMIYLDDSCIIIFDKFLKELFDKNKVVDLDIDDYFLGKMIKSFIYFNSFESFGVPKVYNVYDIYSNNYEYLKESFDILLSDGLILSDFFIDKNFNNKHKDLLIKIFKDNNFNLNKDSIGSYNVNTISKKGKTNDTKNKLMRLSKEWFKKNDKFNEFENYLLEFVESFSE